MTCEIITVGDELLIGQVINTNQAVIAEQLHLAGIRVTRMTTSGDELEEILHSFEEAWQNHDIVLVTGGLGPTHDDITKKALCRFFRCGLITSNSLREHIQTLLSRRNMKWSAASEEQTMVPESAHLLPNPVGTAPGMLFRDGKKLFIAMPGVPYEMKEILDGSILPLLTDLAARNVIRHLTLRTTGIGESLLAQKLGNLDEILQGASLAFLPSPTGVRLRISVHGTQEDAVLRHLEDVERRIRESAERYIYGTGTEELEEVLGRLLFKQGLRIAVAESCTGGHVADRLTNVSGSSAYFERGIITYSNLSKTDLLGVPQVLIEMHGAVSKEVAEAMAAGVRSRARTDIGLSTTGIAGPTGGTPEKPVGLVWIGFSNQQTVFAQRFQFGDERLRFKERASQAAMEVVRRNLLGIG